MKKLFFLLVFNLSFAQTTNFITIAVLDFKNLSKNPGYDFLEKTIAESFITTLKKSEKFKLAERQRLIDLIDEKKLVLSGLIEKDVEETKKIGKLISADAIIFGSFSSIDGNIEINARLVSVDSGEIIMAEKITEKMGDKLFYKINELAESFVLKLLDYKTGYLNLDTTPQGAEVKIDNNVIGITPITEKKMKTGTYKITIVKNGYEIKTTSIKIEENIKNNYNFYLEKKAEKFYRSRFSIFSHFVQFLQPDYQTDYGLSFEYFLGDFSIGIEGGGNILFHSYEDKTAPGEPYKDLMILHNFRFNLLLKYNFFKDSKFVSPYLGGGIGIFTGSSEEYNYSKTAFFYKYILGINFFPSSIVSFFIDAYYYDVGDIILKEKKFNFFGEYTYIEKPVKTANIMLGLGLRIGF
ncbi:MAG: FlgO family outer membrane protein [Brevinematales bacterium]